MYPGLHGSRGRTESLSHCARRRGVVPRRRAGAALGAVRPERLHHEWLGQRDHALRRHIGGDFTQLSFPSGPGVRLNTTSGLRFAPTPTVFGGDVFASAPDGAGGYFIGGDFIGIGDFGRNGIAHILPSGAVDPTFDAGVVNGPVRALAVSGGAVYAGGDFTQIGGQARQRIAKLSATSGNTFSAWNPIAQAGNVHALAVSGGAVFAAGEFLAIGGQNQAFIAKLSATSGNAFSSFNANANFNVRALAVSGTVVYAGGEFSSIGGPGTRNRIAKLSATTGNAFSAFDANPGADDTVRALAVSGSSLYAGGDFTQIGGQARSRIAKLSATSGNAFSAWDPSANGNVNALVFTGGALYAGGEFSGANSIGGQARNRIAKLSATSGNAFASFDPNADDQVNALAASGSTVYAGGAFNIVNTLARDSIAALDSNNAPTGFDAGAVDDTVWSLAATPSAVYAGGEFGQIGGQSRDRIAKLSPTTGDAFSWNPAANNTVWALETDGTNVFAGGDFTNIAGGTRNRIAKLSGASGSAFASFSSNPGADDTVFSLDLDGSVLYAGGGFEDIGGLPRKSVAKLSATSGNAFSAFDATPTTGFVFALDVDGSALYVGGSIIEIDD
ncbi:MAG: hypothetical protein WD649_03695, partial [Thermoleophilaceae bacterium]